VAERRVCSVLFCDVVGFTPLSEARDPEVVRELLTRYFEVAGTVIGRYGGLVALRDALGISHECVRWAWPLAACAADEHGDVAATGELLAPLDSYQPGYLAPALQAERSLSRARLADRADQDDGQAPGAAFATAIASLRQQSTPITLPTGYSTTRSTFSAGVTPRVPPRPSKKPVASGPACTASRCSPEPTPSSTQNPGYRPNRPLRCGVSRVDGLDGAGAARLTEGIGRG
jgi:hypothetical protein